MDIRKRAEIFSRYVGLELKGKITTQGYSAKAVAEGIGRQPAAFNRWLNGKVEIPLSVFCEACEYIDVEPQKLIEDAYSRLAVEHGERTGYVYPHEDFAILIKKQESVIGKPDLPEETKDNVTVGRFGQNDEAPASQRAAWEDDGDTGEDLPE